MDFKGKNVLITGAGGFIGSALAHDVQQRGSRVVGIVRDLDKGMGFKADRLVVGDICDHDLMRRVVSDNEIDVVFHLAASAIVRISAKDPMTTYQTNVMGTVSLLEACRTVGRCKSIVVASSDKAYGDHEELPYVESQALVPKNTYDTSKACMDMIARSYAHNYDMPIVVSRCSNVYGPGDLNLSRIIPNTIRRVLEGKAPLLYSDIENMEREFIHIDDVTFAYLCLAGLADSSRSGSSMYHGQAYNIGGTGAVKIRDLTDLISSAMGKPDLKPDVIQRDPTFREIQRQYISAQKLYVATGWKPSIKLLDGILETVQWYREYFGGRR